MFIVPVGGVVVSVSVRIPVAVEETEEASAAGADAAARIGFDFCFRLSCVLLPPPAPGLELAATRIFLPSINASNRRNSSISACCIQNEWVKGYDQDRGYIFTVRDGRGIT